MAAKKSAASTAWKVFIGVFLTLVLIIVASEFGLRWVMASQMSKQFESQSNEKMEVSFGRFPMIIGMLSGEIPEMNMSTPSTLTITDGKISGQPASEIHVKGLQIGEEPIARELDTKAVLPQEFLLATLQKGIAEGSGHDMLGDVVITDITAGEVKDAVSVEFAGGLFTLTLVPRVENGQLAFDATSSKVLAWELPENITAKISEGLTTAVQDQMGSQGDLKFEDITVGDGELVMTLHGDNVNLNKMGEQFGTSEQAPTKDQAEDPVEDSAPDSLAS